MPRKGNLKGHTSSQQRNDLLGFRHAAPAPQNPHGTSSRRRKGSFHMSAKEQEHRSKARSNFFLQSSAEHTFVLNGVSFLRELEKGRKSCSKSSGSRFSLNHANLVKWDAIHSVNCLVTDEVTCPICLSGYVAPRISKCGHVFCLPCLLRYFHVSVEGKGGSNSDILSGRVGVKCPCCFEALYFDDLRRVSFRTIQLPTQNTVMKFIRLKRRKTSFAPNRRITSETSNKNDESCQTSYNNFDIPFEDESDAIFSRYTQMRPTLQMKNISIEFDDLKNTQKEIFEESELHTFQQAMSLVKQEENELFSLQVSEMKLVNNNGISPIPSEDSRVDNFYEYYQASDGQLCFLSSFNSRCLQEEYKGKDQPAEIFGPVVEVESCHFSDEERKKKPFLSHLPLYSDIRIVEINLSRILSRKTKSKFREEHERRIARRRKKKNNEKREDRRLARQMEKSSLNIPIDPSDEFFHVTRVENDASHIDYNNFDQSFPESVGNRPQRNTEMTFSSNSTFSYNNVCATNGVWPDLTPVNTERHTSSNSHATSNPPSWGVSNELERLPVQSNRKCKGNHKGKRKKNQQITLFSTGGGRIN